MLRLTNLKADQAFELNRQQSYLPKRHNERIDKRKTVKESQNRLRNGKRKERMAGTIYKSINAISETVLPPTIPGTSCRNRKVHKFMKLITAAALAVYRRLRIPVTVQVGIYNFETQRNTQYHL
mmetsp:Transcript_64878/g.76795  ORF Transcript_64878/g.76795 Transcript_64878/m.76795 type:complete len:124 (-) Transcript_64878:127-498(-)